MHHLTSRTEGLSESWLSKRACADSSSILPSAHAQTESLSGVLRVRGLPDGVSADEVVAFFRGYGVTVLKAEFEATGDDTCILHLPSAGCAKRLLAERGQLLLFGSILKLESCTSIAPDGPSPLQKSPRYVPREPEKICKLGARTQKTAAGRTSQHSPRGPFSAATSSSRGPSAAPRHSSPSPSRSPVRASTSHALSSSLKKQRPKVPAILAESSPKFQASCDSNTSINRRMRAPRLPLEDRTNTVQQAPACSSRPSTPQLRKSTPNRSPRCEGYSVTHRVSTPRPDLDTIRSEVSFPQPASASCLRRAESAPPATIGHWALQFDDFSGQEWHTAVSQERLENLRLQVDNVQRDVDLSRDALDANVKANLQLADDVEASRAKIRQLSEAEVEGPAMPTQNSRDKAMDKKLKAGEAQVLLLSAEAEKLAKEIEVSAKLHIDRSQSLADMRIAAHLSRMKSSLQQAMNERDCLRADYASQEQELRTNVETTNSLRQDAEELRDDIRKVVEQEVKDKAAAEKMEEEQQQKLDSSRSQLLKIEQEAYGASQVSAAQHQTQASRNSRRQELSLSLAGMRVATQRLARFLQNAGSEKAVLQAKFFGATQTLAVLKSKLESQDATCKNLAAELQQQHEATVSWQACVDNLVHGKDAISAEAATCIASSHNILNTISIGDFAESRQRCAEKNSPRPL